MTEGGSQILCNIILAGINKNLKQCIAGYDKVKNIQRMFLDCCFPLI
jgi:hypothetical protein